MMQPLLPPALPAVETPTFEAVPRTRLRRNGWTAERQRNFIDALAKFASVVLAAKSVGMTARSAYQLRTAKDSESFARAWDAALNIGFEELVGILYDRAVHGTVKPVYYRGRQVGERRVHHDRLAVSLLEAMRARQQAMDAEFMSEHATATARQAHEALLERLAAASIIPYEEVTVRIIE